MKHEQISAADTVVAAIRAAGMQDPAEVVALAISMACTPGNQITDLELAVGYFLAEARRRFRHGYRNSAALASAA